MKVYDVGSIFWSMDRKFQKEWNDAHGAGADAVFAQDCKAAKALVMAPKGKENKPPFKGATVPQVFTKPVTGFVGQGKDAGAVGSFGDAIVRFALNAGAYPSKAMFVVSAGAADVKDKKNKGEI